jgi:hypothetical protein
MARVEVGLGSFLFGPLSALCGSKHGFLGSPRPNAVKHRGLERVCSRLLTRGSRGWEAGFEEGGTRHAANPNAGQMARSQNFGKRPHDPPVRQMVQEEKPRGKRGARNRSCLRH